MANLYISPSSPGLLQRGPYQLVSEPSISWSIHGGSPELHQLKSYYSQGRSGSWQGFRPETPFQPSISVTSSISAASPHEQSSCSSNGKISQHKDSIDRMLDKLDHMNNELDRVLKEMVRERKEREVQQYMSASLSNSVGNRNPIHVYPTPLQHPYTSAQHVFDEMLTRGGGGGEAPTKAAPLPEPPPPPSFPQPPQQQYRSLQQQEETEPEVFDEVPVRKLGSISWCRRCKIQCATMEGLVLHSLTSEHQNKTMALVLNIKQDIQSGANYASTSEKIASVFAEDSTPGASVAKTDDARLVTRKLREADVAKLELKEDPTATYEDLAIAVTDANDSASTQKQVVQSIGELASSGSVVDDWVGSDPIAEMSTTGSRSEDDPLAEVSFHVTEDKKHDDSGGYNMDLLDFSTVYRFYHYPDTTRLRMSQILTLPPYQSQGYGGRLLESIYSVAISETGLSYSKNWDELRDEKVLADARWAMSYLSEGTNDKIQAVIDAGVCPRLIELLPLPSHTILIHVLRTVRNIVTGDVFVSATYVGASFQVWIWDPGSAIHRRGCNCNMDFGEELQYYVGGGLTAALAVWKWLGIDTELESEMVGKAMNTSVSFWSCVPRSDGMEILEKKLYYEFSIKDLLLEAITHAFAQEIGTCYCYQRLEFLSDAVLVLLITWHLFQTHITIDPGVLTDLRSASVNNERFAKCAVKHKLQHHLQPASGLLLEQITEYVKKLEELHKDEYPLVSNASSKGYKVLVDIVESIAGTILIDTRLNLHKVWEISEPLLASMVSPVSLELPPLRELFELYSHLGYFLKTKCKMV